MVLNGPNLKSYKVRIYTLRYSCSATLRACRARKSRCLQSGNWFTSGPAAARPVVKG